MSHPNQVIHRENVWYKPTLSLSRSFALISSPQSERVRKEWRLKVKNKAAMLNQKERGADGGRTRVRRKREVTEERNRSKRKAGSGNQIKRKEKKTRKETKKA